MCEKFVCIWQSWVLFLPEHIFSWSIDFRLIAGQVTIIKCVCKGVVIIIIVPSNGAAAWRPVMENTLKLLGICLTIVSSISEQKLCIIFGLVVSATFPSTFTIYWSESCYWNATLWGKAPSFIHPNSKHAEQFDFSEFCGR